MRGEQLHQAVVDETTALLGLIENEHGEMTETQRKIYAMGAEAGFQVTMLILRREGRLRP